MQDECTISVSKSIKTINNHCIMKTLSIKQPWATLIASGIKDIENRSWAPNYEGRILIHASSSKVTDGIYKKIIFEQGNIIGNEILFGNMPDFKDLPCSAIVGYATVRGACDDSESVWAEPVDFQWQLEDAYLFDEPICGVNGKLHLWDYPDIDENHLPKAHKLVRRVPRLEGNCLVIPLIESEYEKSVDNGMVNLLASEELGDLIEKPQEEFKEGESTLKDNIKTVRLESPKITQTFAIKSMSYCTYGNEKGEILKTTNWDMEEMDYFDLVIELGNEEK